MNPDKIKPAFMGLYENIPHANHYLETMREAYHLAEKHQSTTSLQLMALKEIVEEANNANEHRLRLFNSLWAAINETDDKKIVLGDGEFSITRMIARVIWQTEKEILYIECKFNKLSSDREELE